MLDQLTTIHRLKMILASASLSIAGVILIALERRNWAGFWDWIPLGEIGGILVGAGLLSVWLDYFLRTEQEAISDRRLRLVMEDHAPAMRDAVLEAFAADHSDLSRVATPETLDRIAKNTLGLRIGDQQFASEIYGALKSQIIDSSERWTHAHLDVRLDRLQEPPRSADYLGVTVRWEYTTIPKHAQRSFVCLSDRDEYAELAAADDGTSAWFYKPDSQRDASDERVFELVDFAVNGEPRKIRRSARKRYQRYSADIGAQVISAGEPVAISYTFRTITPRSGNLLFFDIEQPTKDIQISFDYTDCGFESVSTLDLLPSANEVRIEESHESLPNHVIRVEVAGWTFPRSGVAFVWRDPVGDRDQRRASG